ncbi:TetR/AcrR family transcriptional regulator [Streptomyces sp. NPDC059989]|uniref:TetR/AcrR family transcriptional regulator n=1 Tax=Streptomyces sp. NPDC059989 TaxID=3347026 RepID=UPI0036A382C6
MNDPQDDDKARTRLLDAAEELFYAHGIRAVGMDRIRTASGVPLKRLYRLFPAKDVLVAAYLERRAARWTTSLRAAVAARPSDPLPAVFDWLAEWCSEPGFRGCGFLNAWGELGSGPAGVLEVVRRHRAELRSVLAGIVEPGSRSPELADQLLILFEGATAVAALSPGPLPARQAREMAELLCRR